MERALRIYQDITIDAEEFDCGKCDRRNPADAASSCALFNQHNFLVTRAYAEFRNCKAFIRWPECVAAERDATEAKREERRK